MAARTFLLQMFIQIQIISHTSAVYLFSYNMKYTTGMNQWQYDTVAPVMASSSDADDRTCYHYEGYSKCWKICNTFIYKIVDASNYYNFWYSHAIRAPSGTTCKIQSSFDGGATWDDMFYGTHYGHTWDKIRVHPQQYYSGYSGNPGYADYNYQPQLGIRLLSINGCCYWNDVKLEATMAPTTRAPTSPTLMPSPAPSLAPTTAAPTGDTNEPTAAPSLMPSKAPTLNPTFDPSAAPTTASADPTATPSYEPTIEPTVEPTTRAPTLPTLMPSSAPSRVPTTAAPTGDTNEPTAAPSLMPSKAPTLNPTFDPSAAPTTASVDPTATPSYDPTIGPTIQPTTDPTMEPTTAPSPMPTQPSPAPTESTSDPSVTPTTFPTLPTFGPSEPPTADPSAQSNPPTFNPTVSPFVATFDTEDEAHVENAGNDDVSLVSRLFLVVIVLSALVFFFIIKYIYDRVKRPAHTAEQHIAAEMAQNVEGTDDIDNLYSKPLEQWEEDDVYLWLASVNKGTLKELAEILKAQHIKGGELEAITEEMLKEFGIKLGDRKEFKMVREELFAQYAPPGNENVDGDDGDETDDDALPEAEGVAQTEAEGGQEKKEEDDSKSADEMYGNMIIVPNSDTTAGTKAFETIDPAH